MEDNKVMDYTREALDKIQRESAAPPKKAGAKARVVWDAVAEALSDFCRQSEDFARAVAQSDKTFGDCAAHVVKDAGESLSDAEAYRRAVGFWLPGADIRVVMTLDLGDGGRSKPKHIEMSLDELFGGERMKKEEAAAYIDRFPSVPARVRRAAEKKLPKYLIRDAKDGGTAYCTACQETMTLPTGYPPLGTWQVRCPHCGKTVTQYKRSRDGYIRGGSIAYAAILSRPVEVAVREPSADEVAAIRADAEEQAAAQMAALREQVEGQIAERAAKIASLEKELAEARAVQKCPAPPTEDKKAQVKFYAGESLRAFNAALEAVDEISDPADRDKCVTVLCEVADKMRAAALGD